MTTRSSIAKSSPTWATMLEESYPETQTPMNTFVTIECGIQNPRPQSFPKCSDVLIRPYLSATKISLGRHQARTRSFPLGVQEESSNEVAKWVRFTLSMITFAQKYLLENQRLSHRKKVQASNVSGALTNRLHCERNTKSRHRENKWNDPKRQGSTKRYPQVAPLLPLESLRCNR